MAYGNDKSISQASAKGKVKWFNATKGYGFITLDNGGDAFCHASALQASGHSDVQPGTTIVCDLADSARATKDELMRLFTAFVALLLSDFRHYLRRRPGERVDFRRDGVTFWQRALYLTPEEVEQLSATMDAAIASLEGHPPGPGRRRQLVSFATMPTMDQPDDEALEP